MLKTPKILGLTFATACALSLSAQATTYNGNGGTSFGGPIGNGMLVLTANATTLSGTITKGTSGSFGDELVIYIDSQAGGFTTTSGFTDTNGGTANADTLREAVSGYDGTDRAIANFATGFTADFAIALSPNKASFGALYTLANGATFTYGSDGTNGNANLSPVGTATATTYTFSIPLTLLGSPTSFKLATTYLNGTTGYRSNETIGNTVADTTTPTNTGNIGQDTAALGFVTFSVPEPSTWAATFGGAALLVLMLYRRRRA